MNAFTYQVKNQFISDKETEIVISYCGREIAVAFFYLDGVLLEFTDKCPMINMDEWHYLETVLKQIKRTVRVPE